MSVIDGARCTHVMVASSACGLPIIGPACNPETSQSMLAEDAYCVQATAEELRQQLNLQDLARGIAQHAAQQGSGNAGAIQPKDAVAAAKAGRPLSHMPRSVNAMSIYRMSWEVG